MLLNIGDNIDVIITIILGLICFLSYIKPELFIRKADKLEKAKKYKFLTLIGGIVLFIIALIRILYIIPNS